MRTSRRFYCSLSAVLLVCLGAMPGAAWATAAPTISGFRPGHGPVGTTVVIHGTGFFPPFSITFAGNAAASGSFTSTKITVTVPSGAETGPITVQTAGGTVVTATNFVVGGKGPPSVTLAATVPSVTDGSGKDGKFTVSLPDAASEDIDVSYAIHGTALNGTNYKLLTGTVTIPAGDLSKVIKIVPKGTLSGTAAKTVKLHLEAGDGYAIGTTNPVIVKILPGT